MLLASLSACWLLALTSALDTPRPCSSPKQLEGLFTVFHPTKFVEEYGKFSYDADQKRIYLDMWTIRGGKQLQQVDILLYEKTTMYQFFPNNRTCVKFPLRTPFETFGAPKNATFIGMINIGTTSIPDAGLLENIWSGIRDGVNYVMSFTVHGCLPQYRAWYHADGWYSKSFYNMTIGIQDPNVFIPPPECPL